MTLAKMNFLDFLVHSSRGKNDNFSIYSWSAALTKSKQFHWLPRTSLILTAQQNVTQEKEQEKAPHDAHIIFSMAAFPPVTNHTQLPGLVFQALPPQKEKIYRTPRQKKPWRKSQSQTPLANFLILGLFNTRGKQKCKDIKAAIWCNPATIVTWSATIPAGFLVLLSCRQRSLQLRSLKNSVSFLIEELTPFSQYYFTW